MNSFSGGDVVATAACAWSDGRAFGPSVLQGALRLGSLAASHGRYLPLPVLLDTEALLGPAEPLLREGAPSGGPGGYDQYVWDLVAELRRVLGAPKHRGHRHGAIPGGTQLPFLIRCWPRGPLDANEALPLVGRAYASAADDVTAAQAAWRGARTFEPSAWRRWWPAAAPPAPAGQLRTDVDVLWSRFQGDPHTKPYTLHEAFDHGAADLFLRARDLTAPEGLRRRIRRLQLRRRQLMQPFWDAVEEQHPFWGENTLMTLTLGELGDHKLVNGTTARLGTPTAATPPRPLDVHWAWLSAFPSLLSDAEGASWMKGVAALAFDDWRIALRGLPLRLHLDRCWPLPVRVGGWAPGARWRIPPAAHAGGQALGSAPDMPGDAVRVLFDRPSRAATAATAGSWRLPGPPLKRRDLCLGAVHAADLRDELAFRSAAGPDGTPSWKGPAGALPAGMSHLLVVGAAASAASPRAAVYAVPRAAVDTVRLVSTGSASALPAWTDGDTLGPRVRLLEAVVTLLEACL